MRMHKQSLKNTENQQVGTIDFDSFNDDVVFDDQQKARRIELRRWRKFMRITKFEL